MATLKLYNYLLATPAAPATADDLVLATQAILPLIQTDTARSILAVNSFVDRLRIAIGSPQADTRNKVIAARLKGAAAVIDELVAEIDGLLSTALSDIMHSSSFKKMEATWRGLHYLVFNTETSTMLRLRVLNASKAELLKDMQKAVEFDQSALFKKIYEDEYGTFGGLPYSLLIGDYEIGRAGDDIEFLKKISEVAAAAHAPFIAQASKDLFNLSSFAELGKPRDLKKIFESDDFGGWREFRDMEDARYVTLVLPRALLRLPYGTPDKRNTIECEGLNFNENVGPPPPPSKPTSADGTAYYPSPDNENFLWGNPAYLLAERITNAFSLYNWTAAIRGVEGGGLVEGLPRYTYTSDAGSTELFCPTEVSITDRREKELNDLGFISLCHCKGTAKAAFFGGQTTNLPKKYFSDDANANARISAMLPYMLAASRFAHYIKVIMREKIGSALTRANVESYLNTWISNYVLLDDNATHEVKSSYPLRSAKVAVTDVPGEPGVYRATVFLKPHFQLEELTTSIRLVADVPK
ncbi:EvpB family type VI secretion protein [Janthinobacterium sp. PC23-8]|nr:EvpB family type VI secretion protein [Janthinobacterium sp. PC23-8]